MSKIDEIESPDDLKEVKAHIVKTIEDIGIKCDKLYETAAKPVYESLKNNLSQEEINNLKAQNGISNFENDLEDFIIKNSDQTKLLSQRIKDILKECTNACNQFCNEAELIINKNSFDITKFEADKKDLLDKNNELRKSSKKAIKKFEREWTREVSRFTRKFESKSANVDNQIMTMIDKGGFIGALFTSFKLTKQISKIVTSELNPIAINLESKLEELIAKLNEELDEEINIYVRNSQMGDVIAPIGSAAAGAGIGITASWAWTTASTAGNAALQSISAFTAASATVASTTVNAGKSIGFFPRAWSMLWGGGKAATLNNAAVSATAAKTAAATTALSATISAVVSIGISFVVMYIVQKILHFGLKQLQANRIPSISEKIIADMEKDILKMLETVKNQMIKEYNQMIEDTIIDNVDKIEDIEKFLIDHNPEKVMELETRVCRIKTLLPMANDLKSRLIEIG